MRGSEAIRAAGGQVLVQDEATSVVWGMPGFVARAGLADAALPLAFVARRDRAPGRGRTGARGGGVVSAPVTATATPELPADDFDYLRELMHVRAAIVLEPGKEYLALSRLDPVARDHGLSSVSELVGKLRSRELTSALHDQVVEAMTTNETSFFRDFHPWEIAAHARAAGAASHARSGRGRSRIWSAGAPPARSRTASRCRSASTSPSC